MSLASIIRPETKAAHRMTWYGWQDGQRHRSSVRVIWPGYDAECSCGKGSHTGGAIKARIVDWIFDHRLDAQTGEDLIAAGDAYRNGDGDILLTAQGRARLT